MKRKSQGNINIFQTNPFLVRLSISRNFFFQFLGVYTNEVIIQHHDSIVTALDLGLALNCQYDLSNRTILNDFDLVRFFCRFFSKMLRILEKRTKTKIKFIFIYVSVCHGHKLSFF